MTADLPPGDSEKNPPAPPDTRPPPRPKLDPDGLILRRSLPIGSIGEGSDHRRYKLLTYLERGGMGELFIAEMSQPSESARFVVVKRLLADLLDDKKYVAMFMAESEVMSKLDHPNIVRVFDTPIFNGTQCLAMEYVHGKNVQRILARCSDLGKQMPAPIALGIMSRVLRGLDYAHTFRQDGKPLQLVHRDVTPGNVLISHQGEVKLTDFGIAKSRMSVVSTTVGIVKGKARYLAPEQILGEQATPRSDVFSSASVVVEMLTGIPLFDRGSVPKTLYAIVNGEKPDLEEIIPFRAPLLVQILSRALHTDPRARLQTAKDLAEGLEAAAHLLGKPHDGDAIGAYVRDLFRGVHDPFAAFDPSTIESLEQPTIHGYEDDPGGHKTSEKEAASASDAARPTSGTAALAQLAHEALGGNRPRPIEIREPPTNVIASIEGEPAITPAPSITSNDFEARASSSSPPSPSDALELAAEPSNGSKAAPGASVDEALSVLAWLQSHPPPRSTDPPAGPLEPREGGDLSRPSRAERRGDDGRDRTIERGPREGRVLLFVLFACGMVTGVLATLALQSLAGSSRESKAGLEHPLPRPEASAMNAHRAAAESSDTPREIASGRTPPEPESDSGDDTTLDEGYETEEGDALDQDLEPLVNLQDPEPAENADEAPPRDSGGTGRTDFAPGPPATIELLEPKGARIRVDGVLLREKVPFRGVPIKPGKHRAKIFKGRLKRELTFSANPGEKVDLTRRLKRRVPAPK